MSTNKTCHILTRHASFMWFLTQILPNSQFIIKKLNMNVTQTKAFRKDSRIKIINSANIKYRKEKFTQGSNENASNLI